MPLNYKSVLVTLSGDAMKEDLENACDKDVVFNKDVYMEITGQRIDDTQEQSATESCYQDVLKFLHGQEEMRDFCSELIRKKEDIKELKGQLEVWMQKVDKGREELKQGSNQLKCEQEVEEENNHME